MTAEEIKKFYNRYIEAANARDFDYIASITQENIVLNGKPGKREDSIAAFKSFTDAVPDFKWKLEEIVIQGNRIAARLRDTGTPKKPAFGMEATGASVSFDEVAFYELKDGRFEKMWFMMDLHTISQQLNRK